jgi:ABC-type multidrug transport system fused ATPase/permease subunit
LKIFCKKHENKFLVKFVYFLFVVLSVSLFQISILSMFVYVYLFNSFSLCVQSLRLFYTLTFEIVSFSKLFFFFCILRIWCQMALTSVAFQLENYFFAKLVFSENAKWICSYSEFHRKNKSTDNVFRESIWIDVNKTFWKVSNIQSTGKYYYFWLSSFVISTTTNDIGNIISQEATQKSFFLSNYSSFVLSFKVFRMSLLKTLSSE